MAREFDPYYEWLGIPPKDQPPHHYRLLGIEPFEPNPDVIERAADRQMRHVRSFQSGPHSAASQRLLNELAAARICLLQPARRAEYDLRLRTQLAARLLPDWAGSEEKIPELPPAIPDLPPAATESVATDKNEIRVPATAMPAESVGPVLIPSGPTPRPAAGPRIDPVGTGRQGGTPAGSGAGKTRSERRGKSDRRRRPDRKLLWLSVVALASLAVLLAVVVWLQSEPVGRSVSPPAPTVARDRKGAAAATKVPSTSAVSVAAKTPASGIPSPTPTLTPATKVTAPTTAPTAAPTTAPTTAPTPPMPMPSASPSPAAPSKVSPEKTAPAKSPSQDPPSVPANPPPVPAKTEVASAAKSPPAKSTPEKTAPANSPPPKSAAEVTPAVVPPRNGQTLASLTGIPRELEAKVAAEIGRLRESHQAEWSTAKTSRELQALADRLVKEAAQTPERPIKGAWLLEARRVAVESGDWPAALRTIAPFCAEFAVDTWTVRTEALLDLAEHAKDPVDRLYCTDLILAQLPELLEQGDADRVEPLLAAVAGMARGDRGLARRLAELRKRCAEGKKLRAAAISAQTKLQTAATDAKAHETLGRWLAFYRHDFESGFHHLQQGADKQLSAVAAAEGTVAAEPDQRFQVAEDWAAVARSESDPVVKGAAALRGVRHYQACLEGLTGVKKLQAEKQLEELTRLAATVNLGADRFAWLAGEPGLALELRGHTEEVTAVALGRSGRVLASASRDDSLRGWDLATGKIVSTVYPRGGDLSGVLLSADETLVSAPVQSGSNHSLGIWNLQTTAPVAAVPLEGASRFLAGSLDWRCVVAGRTQSGPGSLLLRNLSVAPPQILPPFGCRGTPLGAAVSRSGRLVVAADEHKVIYRWDLKSGKALPSLEGLAEPATSLAISPTERYLASCGGATITVWDLNLGTEVHRITLTTGVPTALAFSADGGTLLVGGTRLPLTLYALDSGRSFATIEGASTVAGGIRQIVPSPDGRYAITAGGDSVVRVWRLPREPATKP